MKRPIRKLLAGLLALSMLVSAAPAVSAQDTAKDTPAQPAAQATQKTPETAPDHADSDTVRVSILLEDPSALECYGDADTAGKDIAADPGAQAYQDALLARQQAVADAISAEVLDGEPLDIVWNLTLVSNTISANVPYGALDAIRDIPGVSEVVVEPFGKASEQATESSSASAYAGQLGTVPVYDLGYTGAGMRIAILDTGISPNHISFDEKALAYALTQDYGPDYSAELNLLTVSEIRSKWSRLHVSQLTDLTADEADALYGGEKIPFHFNYPDHATDKTYGQDIAGAHGSHVAGIAGANRYIFRHEGDSEPVLAAEQVLVQGVAPDAQLLNLQIIGSSGGAYPSDQYAAIEDALVLGADVINMSLGTDWAGLTYNDGFQAVLDRLQQTDTVVTVSAGNYGSFIDMGSERELLSIEDVSMNTVCDPGSFRNAFTIASADSNSRIGVYFTVNGGAHKVFYWSSSGGANLADLASDTPYQYVYLDSIGVVRDANTLTLEGGAVQEGKLLENQLAALDQAIDGGLAGKVVIVNRGMSTFAAKADAAAELGARAVVIVNNESGSVSADLQNYQHEDVPVVTLDLSERTTLLQNTQSGTISTRYDKDGNAADGAALTYYTGTITIPGKYAAEPTEFPTEISNFSAWGVPGSLELKPEITTPGSNIFSVYGLSEDGKGYLSLSGTSMAAAQAAGLTALVMQYVQDNNLKAKTGLTNRALVQSLLMSTAVPMQEEDGRYYPLLQQGAGLANGGNAVSAESYITVSGQPDGKVKAELGDDPDRTGTYQTTFTIHNLTDEEQAYNIRADLFTQAIETQAGEKCLSTHTANLDAKVTVDGAEAPVQVSVPAGGETTVSVEMALTTSQKASLNANYPNGAYIQAFVYAEPADKAGVTHSIPVLAFYGNWTDPSMFDSRYCPKALTYAGTYGLSLTVHNDVPEDRLLSAPYGETDQYVEDRNAFDPAMDILSQCSYLPLRNYTDARCTIQDADTGTVYWQEDLGEGYGLYYNDDTGAWGSTGSTFTLDWDGTDAEGTPLPDGTKVSVSLTLAPEYYRSPDGKSIRWEDLGKGATISTTVSIDRSAPELIRVEDSTLDEGYITITVQDNEYVGMAALYSLSSMTDEGALSYVLVDQKEPGEPVTLELTLNDMAALGDDLILKIGDYAGHIATYPLGQLKDAQIAVASPEVSVAGDGATTQITDFLAEDLLRQIQENHAKTVTVIPQISSAEDITSLDIALPCTLVGQCIRQRIDSIYITSPIGNITIPRAAFPSLSASQGQVWISLYLIQDNLHLELSADGKTLENIPGGLEMQIPQPNCSSTLVAALRLDGGAKKILPTSAADSNTGLVSFTLYGTNTVYFLSNQVFFLDVPLESWYAEGVSFAAAHELVSGTGNDRFSPTANITRASIATLLYHLEWEPESGLKNPFSDVAKGAWYETPVAWAASNHILSGNGAGKFNPDADITREQLAVFLYNYAKHCGLDLSADTDLSSFADKGSVSSWAQTAMEWAVSHDLIHGVGGNRLMPKGTATRAEVAVLMMHYVQYLAGIEQGN